MEEKELSSTGLEPNVAGLLCYVFGFITGIIFLIVEKKSSFVKFHARQSTITSLVFFALYMVIGWFPVFWFLLSTFSAFLWILLMIKALQGKRYALPIIGKWAEEKADR